MNEARYWAPGLVFSAILHTREGRAEATRTQSLFDALDEILIKPKRSAEWNMSVFEAGMLDADREAMETNSRAGGVNVSLASQNQPGGCGRVLFCLDPFLLTQRSKVLIHAFYIPR
ncbi:hypothetical protein UPYG_G00126330 [Umbra pygmaea]|uniref:Uncharacterized protein n=1 Tax=Umbra pygmaea TaxID=75934 RepID=A0ABD0X6W6_UMBPY